MIALIVLGQGVGGLAGRVCQGLSAEVTADDGHLAEGDWEGRPAAL